MNTHLQLCYYYSCRHNQMYSALAEVLKKSTEKDIHHSVLAQSLVLIHYTLIQSGLNRTGGQKKQNGIFKAQAVSLQSEIFKYEFSWFCQGSDCWFCFAGSWDVDTGRSNHALMRVFEILDISVPFYLAQSYTKIASCIFIHKIVNSVNID